MQNLLPGRPINDSTVYFYYKEDASKSLPRDSLMAEKHLAFLLGGRRCWVLQTFIRLKSVGYDVALTNQVVGGAVNVYHADDRNQVYRSSEQTRKAVLIAIRADRPGDAFADYEIVQNGYFNDDSRVSYIPHWPQPALIERNPERGDLVQRVGFKGLPENLLPEIQSEWFRSQLIQRDMCLDMDTKSMERLESDIAPFVDYSNIDVVIAIRAPGSFGHRNKPASKLVNAWRAGCPAILGKEYPYQELRQSDEDFLEATDARKTLEQIDRLRENPQLYRAIAENGRVRAQQFTFESITNRWIAVLEEIKRRSRLKSHAERRISGIARLAKWHLFRQTE